MADHFATTYYVLDPSGVVHRVKTATIGDLRALDAFRRETIIHGYSAKGDTEVEHAVKAKLYSGIWGETIKHEIQEAFLEANGSFRDHDSTADFFEAIGYVDALKRRCKARFKKYIQDGTHPDGTCCFIDEKPYRVELPGIAA